MDVNNTYRRPTRAPIRAAASPPSESGIALLVVLWGLTLLSIMVTSFAFVTRGETSQVTNMLDKARARAAAEAGISHAVMDLFRRDDVRILPVDGTVQEWRYGGVPVRVALESESGKIDLNAAKRELLKGLLAAAGVDAQEQEALVDAIEDWRDADQARRLHGAEDDDYAAVGLAFGAKDAPFDSVDELNQVLGMTPDLFRRLEPSVTVYSKRPGIDPVVASESVLRALPDIDPTVIDAYLTTRAEAHERGETPPNLPEAVAYKTGGGQTTYRVRAEARMEGGAGAVLEAVIKPSIRAQRMYDVLAWREDQPSESPAAGSL